MIADAREVDGQRRIELIAYRLNRTDYERVPLDARGRAWLAPVKLWLGAKVDPETGDDRLVLIDPITDQEIGDYTAVNRARAAAEARADAEARARAAAEARAAELEAELRRLRGRKRR